MLFKFRKRKTPSRSRRVRRTRGQEADAASVMSRGIVTLSICAGAGMWGYAMVNLAT